MTQTYIKYRGFFVAVTADALKAFEGRPEDQRPRTYTADSAEFKEWRAAIARPGALSPRQAREWLILNDMDEKLEESIAALRGKDTAESIRQFKVARNWYDNADSWVYGHPQLEAMLKALGVDQDKFFAEASKL